MKISEIKFDKLKSFLSKLPRKMAERAFITFLGFLLLFLIFGALLFYKYVFLAQNVTPDILDDSAKFNEKLFQEISQKITERGQNFKSADLKQYPDPFLSPAIIKEPPVEIPPAPPGPLEEIPNEENGLVPTP